MCVCVCVCEWNKVPNTSPTYVPMFLSSHQLYQIAKKSRSRHTGEVEMVGFASHHGYGHKNIYKAPELKDIVE